MSVMPTPVFSIFGSADRLQWREYQNPQNALDKPMNAQAATVAAAASSTLILLREDIDDVAILTLNRPQARNSLSEATLEALADALTAIALDRSVRAVIIAANGPAFSAGHDLKEL